MWQPRWARLCSWSWMRPRTSLSRCSRLACKHNLLGCADPCTLCKGRHCMVHALALHVLCKHVLLICAQVCFYKSILCVLAKHACLRVSVHFVQCVQIATQQAFQGLPWPYWLLPYSWDVRTGSDEQSAGEQDRLREPACGRAWPGPQPGACVPSSCRLSSFIWTCLHEGRNKATQGQSTDGKMSRMAARWPFIYIIS